MVHHRTIELTISSYNVLIDTLICSLGDMLHEVYAQRRDMQTFYSFYIGVYSSITQSHKGHKISQTLKTFQSRFSIQFEIQ